jgi:hypothetical protein
VLACDGLFDLLAAHLPDAAWPGLAPPVRLLSICGVAALPEHVQLCAVLLDATWSALTAGVSGRGAAADAFRSRLIAGARLSGGVAKVVAEMAL